jgi:RecB family exonuclease
MPGLRGSLASTLQKAWSADYDLATHTADHPRIAALARIEEAVTALLPPGQLRPADLVAGALDRIGHAPRVLGQVDFRGFADLDRCWRPLVVRLAETVRVSWDAGPLSPPAWLALTKVDVRQSRHRSPAGMRTLSCASARHEATEAVRWARLLLASGTARPHQIAIAAASTAPFDDFMLAASEESGLPVYFAHGRSVLQTRDGQTAAALADVLLRGLSQSRVRRLAAFSDKGTPFAELPDGWRDVLPRDAPLRTPERWHLALAGQDKARISERLLPLIEMLARGAEAAEETGELLLRGAARTLWRRALANAPGSALEQELGRMRTPDETDPASSIAWAPAATLGACPRQFVWLLGMNAQAWPRASSDDPLLPPHVLGVFRIEELTIGQQDRRAFELIKGTTAREVRLSFSRREVSGRKLGVSPLIDERSAELLYRTGIPEHAMSEPDRLLARPDEFAVSAAAIKANACWRDWHKRTLTEHDGIVPPNHPAIVRSLDRTHSATSLELLIRNPLGYMLRYALGMRAPDIEGEDLELNHKDFGTLVHELLDVTVSLLPPSAGVGHFDPNCLSDTMTQASQVVAARWEAERPVPPGLLWRITLARAEVITINALQYPYEVLAGQRSFTEVPFGQSASPTAKRTLPWDVTRKVVIPGVGLRIGGKIDRLDLSEPIASARVVDYKTGRPRKETVLRGGRELQRCLYGYAVRALLASVNILDTALLYPSHTQNRPEDNHYAPLAEPDVTLAQLSAALTVACANLRSGLAVPGIAAGAQIRDTRNLKDDDNRRNERDDSAFALPVVPGTMLEPKKISARERLGDIPNFWEVV